MHIFNVSFDLLLLFFSLFYFSSFQSHSSSGFMKNAVFMCLSPSVILPASVMTFTDVSLCLCPSLRVVKLSFSLSVSLSPKRALRCLSVTPSLCLFHVTGKNRWLITLPTLYTSTPPKHFWHRRSLCWGGSADTTLLYGNKAMQQHPGQVDPLVDVCLIFNQARHTITTYPVFLFRLFIMKSQTSYGMPWLRSQCPMTVFSF